MPIDAREAREGVARLAAGVVQAMGLAMRAGVAAATASAKGTTLFKDRTGATRASIVGTVEGFSRGFVRAGGVARLLESGTRPHLIVGRPILRFVVGGQTIFRRFVHHPGTAERPFMSEARRAGEQALEYGLEFFISAAVERA